MCVREREREGERVCERERARREEGRERRKEGNRRERRHIKERGGVLWKRPFYRRPHLNSLYLPCSLSLSLFCFLSLSLSLLLCAGHTQGVRDITFNFDGTQFLSAGYDRYVRLWDTESGACVRRFTNKKVPYCVKFNPSEENRVRRNVRALYILYSSQFDLHHYLLALSLSFFLSLSLSF